MAEPNPKILVRSLANFGACVRCAPCVFSLMALLTGCGVQGPIVVRRPVVPRAIGDLSAQQRGDAIVLSFTLPEVSTQQQPLPEPPEVDIYRSTGAAAGTAPAASKASHSQKRQAHTACREAIPGGKIKQYEVNRAHRVCPAASFCQSRERGFAATYLYRAHAESLMRTCRLNRMRRRCGHLSRARGD